MFPKCNEIKIISKLNKYLQIKNYAFNWSGLIVGTNNNNNNALSFISDKCTHVTIKGTGMKYKMLNTEKMLNFPTLNQQNYRPQTDQSVVSLIKDVSPLVVLGLAADSGLITGDKPEKLQCC